MLVQQRAAAAKAMTGGARCALRPPAAESLAKRRPQRRSEAGPGRRDLGFHALQAEERRDGEGSADDAGDVWTWTALDADSKLMISYMASGRTGSAGHVRLPSYSKISLQRLCRLRYQLLFA